MPLVNDKVIKKILEKLKFNMVTDRKSESAILLSSLLIVLKLSTVNIRLV